MLKIDDHVAEICKKASKQLAVLKTLQVGIVLIKEEKMVIYDSFISLNLVIAPWVGTFVALPVQINWKRYKREH